MATTQTINGQGMDSSARWQMMKQMGAAKQRLDQDLQAAGIDPSQVMPQRHQPGQWSQGSANTQPGQRPDPFEALNTAIAGVTDPTQQAALQQDVQTMKDLRAQMPHYGRHPHHSMSACGGDPSQAGFQPNMSAFNPQQSQEGGNPAPILSMLQQMGITPEMLQQALSSQAAIPATT